MNGGGGNGNGRGGNYRDGRIRGAGVGFGRRPPRNGPYNHNRNANQGQRQQDMEVGNQDQGQAQQNGGDAPAQRKQWDGPNLGYKKLHGFLQPETEPNVVVAEFNRFREDWRKLLKADDQLSYQKIVRGQLVWSDDYLVLVLHLLAEKICSNDVTLTTAQIQILNEAVRTTEFMEKLDDKCKRLFGYSSGSTYNGRQQNANALIVDQTPAKFFQSLHTFFLTIANKMQITALDFISKVIPSAYGAVVTLNMNNPAEFAEILAKFDDLNNRIYQIREMAEKKKKEDELRSKQRYAELSREEEIHLHTLRPPEDFKEFPIIPTMNEVHSKEEPFLRPNKTSGAYMDAEHYLDVQFRLLREDFVNPLKKGIQDFVKNRQDYLNRKKKMPIGSVRVYPKVKMKDIKLIQDKVVHFVQLHESNYRKIKWERSKRLLAGSLLVFSCDNFVTGYFGIVYRRDEKELKKGVLGVIWEGDSPTNERNKEFVMVECEVYFEAYRYTLDILKEIPLDEFPMARFIVGASPIVNPPTYLQHFTDLYTIVSKGGRKLYVSPLVDHTWPTAYELDLDQMQFDAFKACLTKEFCIVQGAPGCGKTFLGLKVIEVLLRNVSTAGPILVVCYTNHALDQFLEGCLEIIDKLKKENAEDGGGRHVIGQSMIRVGGRCQTEVLQQYTLNRQRQMASKLRQIDLGAHKMKMEAQTDVQKYQTLRAQLMNQILGLNDLKGIVKFNYLEEIPRELEDSVPSRLWNALKSEDFYGLRNLVQTHMNPDKVIQNLFKIPARHALFQGKLRYLKDLSLEDKHQQQRDRPSTSRAVAIKEEVEDDDDDDDEDYDLNELMANRIIDDIYAEVESQQKNHISSNIPYRFELSTADLDENIDQLQDMIRQANKSKLNPAQRETTILKCNADLQRLQAQKAEKDRFNEIQSEIIQKIAYGFYSKTLDFPNVDLVLENLNDLDLFRLDNRTKWALYFYVVEKAKEISARRASEVSQDLIRATKRLQEAIELGDGVLLKKARVVGMTTTGAAKYHSLVKMMKSKIVIVEEAAEVLEAHIVTCLTKHCEHVILIGDHQQLRPSTTVYELSQKYHLDISLFERMVNNKLHCHQINVQHRMRPDISDLLRGPIYKEIHDHTRVAMYPPVMGVACNLFFISHQEKERSDSDSKSKSNPHEAKFVAELCRYLILQGYTPDKITILTTYTGQMFLLKNEMRTLESCKGVRVTVVDNFQGEENDLILLSLVRSNEEDNIGFLKTDNRICVAISRAKHGLFIIGNLNSLVTKSKTWRQIEKKLEAKSHVGHKLKLACQMHGNETEVMTGEDFKQCPEGGCTAPCLTPLKCGHVCKSVCHPMDQAHQNKYAKCYEPCTKQCAAGIHACKAKCYQECPACKVVVEKELPCRHSVKVYCHSDISTIRCDVLVTKKLPCGHETELACHRHPTSYKCQVKVEKTLKCGQHKKTMECSKDPELQTCRVQVDKKLPCGHETKDECWLNEDQIKCEAEVEIEVKDCKHKMNVKCRNKNNSVICQSICVNRLPCGHQCTKKCHVNEDPEHVNYVCKKDCGRLCNRGHRCKVSHKCHTNCPPCKELAMKNAPCGHQLEVECHVNISTVECTFPCEKRLVCGHNCGSLCFNQPCPPCMVEVQKRSAACGHSQEIECSVAYTRENCETLVTSMMRSPCGHTVKVPCKVALTVAAEDLPNFCDSPCGTLFDKTEGGCGHYCKGTCKNCKHGRLHIKCQEKCERSLVCGHQCDFPCSMVCPPCKKVCNMKCQHSQCQNKCGDPCAGCSEHCTYECPHKKCSNLCHEECDRDPCNEPCPKSLLCGHPCIGFCGEPCPRQCRICNKIELTEFILYGNEFDEDARFVLMEDCGHAIEVEGLDYYMNNQIEEGEIESKRCPRCKQLIRGSKRYGNILKNRLKDVIQVKLKLFGDEEKIAQLHQSIVERVIENNAWRTNFPIVHGILNEKLVRQVKAPSGGGSAKAKSLTRQRILYKTVDLLTLGSIEIITKHGEDCIKLLAEIEREKNIKMELHVDLHDRYTALLQEMVERQLPLSRIEVKDFDREFQRLFDLRQIYKRKSHGAFYDGHQRGTPIYQNILKLIHCIEPYTEGIKNQLHGLLKDLDEVLKTGLGISDRERREILDAIGMAAGRWFKCPNGHVYVITECGGAVSSGRCNECGAAIGGTAYRLANGNRIATEMDGATQSLYPGMA